MLYIHIKLDISHLHQNSFQSLLHLYAQTHQTRHTFKGVEEQVSDLFSFSTLGIFRFICVSELALIFNKFSKFACLFSTE